MNDNRQKKSTSLYNLGNSLLMANKVAESIDAYKASLKLDPDNMEAKYNLGYAQDLLKQQQQQQQQQNQDQNNKDNQDNKDQTAEQDQQQNKIRIKTQQQQQSSRSRLFQKRMLKGSLMPWLMRKKMFRKKLNLQSKERTGADIRNW